MCKVPPFLKSSHILHSSSASAYTLLQLFLNFVSAAFTSFGIPPMQLMTTPQSIAAHSCELKENSIKYLSTINFNPHPASNLLCVPEDFSSISAEELNGMCKYTML